MPKYIRPENKQAIFFFTVVAFERRKIFCDANFLVAFKKSIKQVQNDYPFDILAWVQMPDHLHCMWKITNPQTDYSKCWAKIKRLTTQQCKSLHLPIADLSYSKVVRDEKGLFQRRFFEHKIRDEEDFERHMNYIHYNPVKHGLVERVQDWEYSSFHRYVKQNVYSLDWGCNMYFADNFSNMRE